MLNKLNKVAEYLGGSMSEKFLKTYYGKYFTGSITIMEDNDAGTMYLHNGCVYTVESGIPETGIDTGLASSKEGWDAFQDSRRSLNISSSPALKEKQIKTLGGVIRVRSCQSPLALVAKIYSCVRDGVDPAIEPVRDLENEALGKSSSVRGFFKIINGVRIYIDTNDGPDDKATIICVHTSGRDTRQYHDMMDILADKYRMYAFDLPGHGKSFPMPGNEVCRSNDEFGKWIWGVVEALGVKNPIIIGTSFGGNIVLHMAAYYPVRAIVSMSGGDYFPGVSQTILDLLYNPAVSCQHSHLENTDCLIGTRTPQSRVDFIFWGVQTETGLCKQGDLTMYGSFDIRAQLPDITCPVLFVYGEDDQSIAPGRPAELAAKLTGSKNVSYKVIPGYGHFITNEAPEQVCGYIDEFIKSFS